MSVYLVQTPAGNYPTVNGINGQIVQANSSTEAKALAKGSKSNDSNSAWGDATPVVVAAAAALTGWVFRVQVNTGTPVDVTVTGDADDTLDDIGTKLAAALLTAVGTAISGTAHSAYNTGTNLLTVASIADNIGNKTVTVTVTPPSGLFSSDYTWAQGDAIGTITHNGIAGAVLTVQLSTTWVIPSRSYGVTMVD